MTTYNIQIWLCHLIMKALSLYKWLRVQQRSSCTYNWAGSRYRWVLVFPLCQPISCCKTALSAALPSVSCCTITSYLSIMSMRDWTSPCSCGRDAAFRWRATLWDSPPTDVGIWGGQVCWLSTRVTYGNMESTVDIKSWNTKERTESHNPTIMFLWRSCEDSMK